LTVVAPVKVLAPDSVRVPVPSLASPPASPGEGPPMVPLNTVLVLLPLVVRTLPAVGMRTVPLPASEAIGSLLPPRLTRPGGLTTSGLVSAMALPPAPLPIRKVPAVSVTVPVPAFRALAMLSGAGAVAARNCAPLDALVLTDSAPTLTTNDCPLVPTL